MKPQMPAPTKWKYEALKIAVLYVLEHESPMTTAQLAERIGVNRTGNIMAILRIGMSSQTLSAAGWPVVYTHKNWR